MHETDRIGQRGRNVTATHVQDCSAVTPRRLLPGRALLLGLCCVALAFALVACGRSGDGGATDVASPRVIPTMPPASFAQPTTMIGVAAPSVDADSDTDTDEADASESAADSEEAESAEPVETPSPPGPDLARGETVYQARGCGDCHGARGEGVPGEGSALAGLTLSESEFTTILRTGGSGRLGSGHLYGPSAISPGGMSALYAWLESLDE